MQTLPIILASVLIAFSSAAQSHRNGATERPAQRMESSIAPPKVFHLFLLPGTAREHILGRPTVGELPNHPDLGNWVPSKSPYSSNRNTADALTDMVRSRLPPGSDLEVHVFAKGGESKYWYGRDDKAARELAGAELTAKVNGIPANEGVILAGHSHGNTVGGIAANSSGRGVDLFISLANPGLVQPDPAKVRAAINFVHGGDSIVARAGNNHPPQGPWIASSPGRIHEPNSNFRNVPLDSILCCDPAGNPLYIPKALSDVPEDSPGSSSGEVGDSILSGIPEHSLGTHPDVIDGPVRDAFGKWLSHLPSSVDRAGEANRPAVGDVLTEGGRQWNTEAGQPRIALPSKNQRPFSFDDPNTDYTVSPVDASATVHDMKGLAGQRLLDKLFREIPTAPTGNSPGARGGLSDVTVSSTNISITLIDHGKVDDDIINLILNGKVVLRAFTLKGPPGDSLKVALAPGNNIIEIFAVNEGDISPNTAQLVMTDVVTGRPIQEYRVGLNESAKLTLTAPGASAASPPRPGQRTRQQMSLEQITQALDYLKHLPSNPRPNNSGTLSEVGAPFPPPSNEAGKLQDWFEREVLPKVNNQNR